MASKTSGVKEVERTSVTLRWVERLLEPSASEAEMIEAALELTQSYYSDVVDERNIEQLCGYPPCDKPLGPQPRQKYHISLAQKKVFDLTQRKKFCSVECYRASNYYASQLVTGRKEERKISTVRLLPHRITKSEPSQQIKTNALKVQQSQDLGVVVKEVSVEDNVKRVEELALIERGGDETKEYDEEEGIVSRESLIPPTLSSIGRLLHAMSSWCTPETFHHLEQINHKHRQDTAKSDKDITTPHKEPQSLNDSKTVEDSKTYSKETIVKDTDYEAGSSEVVIPAVHSSAHSQLQRSIFMQQLRRNISNVSAQFGHSSEEALPRILPLVNTFRKSVRYREDVLLSLAHNNVDPHFQRFSRHTVMFKPAEWKIIIFVLSHVVTPEWEDVRKKFSGAVEEMLKAVNATETDLDIMLHTFTRKYHSV